MIHYRKSRESDLGQIKSLIELCFGDRTAYFIYYNLSGRYSLAFEDDKLIAMTGLTDNCVFEGLEVDWTCVHPDYRHLGLVTNMLRKLIPSDKDIYCSCWRVSDKINLYYAMYELNFELLVENFRVYENNSEACKICVNNDKKENCHCSEDLYIKKREVDVMTNTERIAKLRGRLLKVEQKNASSGVARKLKRQIRNLSK